MAEPFRRPWSARPPAGEPRGYTHPPPPPPPPAREDVRLPPIQAPPIQTPPLPAPIQTPGPPQVPPGPYLPPHPSPSPSSPKRPRLSSGSHDGLRPSRSTDSLIAYSRGYEYPTPDPHHQHPPNGTYAYPGPDAGRRPSAPAAPATYTCRVCAGLQPLVDEVVSALAELDLESKCGRPSAARGPPPTGSLPAALEWSGRTARSATGAVRDLKSRLDHLQREGPGSRRTSTPSAPHTAHIQDLQHQVSTKTLAVQTLQQEHEAVLGALSRTQTKVHSLEKAAAATEAEVVATTEDRAKLQAQCHAFERQVDELVASRDEARAQSVANGGQYMQIMEMASQLEKRSGEDKREWDHERSEWEHARTVERSEWDRERSEWTQERARWETQRAEWETEREQLKRERQERERTRAGPDHGAGWESERDGLNRRIAHLEQENEMQINLLFGPKSQGGEKHPRTITRTKTARFSPGTPAPGLQPNGRPSGGDAKEPTHQEHARQETEAESRLEGNQSRLEPGVGEPAREPGLSGPERIESIFAAAKAGQDPSTTSIFAAAKAPEPTPTSTSTSTSSPSIFSAGPTTSTGPSLFSAGPTPESTSTSGPTARLGTLSNPLSTPSLGPPPPPTPAPDADTVLQSSNIATLRHEILRLRRDCHNMEVALQDIKSEGYRIDQLMQKYGNIGKRVVSKADGAAGYFWRSNAERKGLFAAAATALGGKEDGVDDDAHMGRELGMAMEEG